MSQEFRVQCETCPGTIPQKKIRQVEPENGRHKAMAFCRRCYCTTYFFPSPELLVQLQAAEASSVSLLRRLLFAFRVQSPPQNDSTHQRKPRVSKRHSKADSEKMKVYVDRAIVELNSYSRLCALLEREEDRWKKA